MSWDFHQLIRTLFIFCDQDDAVAFLIRRMAPDTIFGDTPSVIDNLATIIRLKCALLGIKNKYSDLVRLAGNFLPEHLPPLILFKVADKCHATL